MPPPPPEESTSVASAEDTVSRWLVESLAVSSPNLGRDGALCPFVKPALNAGAIRYRVAAVSDSPGLEQVADATGAAIDDFERLDWGDTPKQLQCLVVMFPGMDPASATLLDQLHGEMKDHVVDRGLMFAQFHPKCTVASVRNEDVTVGSAPVPLLVFRRLAVHDVLFLGQCESWFATYRERFGHRFEGQTGLEPFLVDAYRRAEGRFGEVLDGRA